MRGIQHFNVGNQSLLDALDEFYLSSYLQDGGAAYKMVVGDYGSGKSHFLYCLRDVAWARNFAVAKVDLSPVETPYNDQKKVNETVHYSFRPSILIQQIFSLIKQSPIGSVRLADLRRIAPPEMTSEDIRKILTQLNFGRYLQPGRLGEWKPDRELQELLDTHEIYTTIGADVGSLTAVDARSGRTIAQTDTAYPPGTIVLFGGKAMRVAWVDKYQFGLVAAEGAEIDAILRFAKAAVAIPFDVTQAVARALDLPAGQMTFLPQERGIVLFHFWGTVWGMLLAATLQEHGFLAGFINEYALHVAGTLPQLPPYDAKVVQKAARTTADTLATRLEMGRFHSLLPGDVALAATLNQLNLPQFGELYQSAQITKRPDLFPQLDLLLQ